MATFVLVHGAWHGSWCWARVQRTLLDRGHEVFAPTLSGVADRSHLLSRAIDLQHHIDDVTGLIRSEDLGSVILCGHSYGGFVISGAGDALPDRVAALVYLDAFVPEDGQSLHDLVPPQQRQLQRNLAAQSGDGWRVPPIPAEIFNVNPRDREWVDRQCTPQPLATFEQPIRLGEGLSRIRHKHFILASDWEATPFMGFFQLAKSRGWTTSEIACGHDVMLDRPDDLAAELIRVADSPG